MVWESLLFLDVFVAYFTPIITSCRIMSSLPSSGLEGKVTDSNNTTAYAMSETVSFCAQNKLEGTLWMDMDDAKVFKILDLEDIEKTFSAYQRQQVRALRCSRLILELMRHEIYQQSCFDFPFLILISLFFFCLVLINA